MYLLLCDTTRYNIFYFYIIYLKFNLFGYKFIQVVFFFSNCYQFLDYETTSSYSLTINVTDDTTTVSQPLTISIRDVNDAPSFTDVPYSVSVNENEAAGAVFTVSASDPDSGKFSKVCLK